MGRNRLILWIQIVSLMVISVVLWKLYCSFNTSGYLYFSDGAKIADVAKSIVLQGNYLTHFIFFGSKVVIQGVPVFASWILPAVPLSIAVFFKTFGISDFTVIATSFFYFSLLVIFSFLLGRKLFGNFVGFLTGLVIATNVNFLEYAALGASETLFAFEIVLVAYLFLLRKKWTDISGFFSLVLMYFTRQQAFIYIAGLLLFWLLLKFKTKQAVLYFAGLLVLGLAADFLILRQVSGKFFLYSISQSGGFAVTQHLPNIASSEALRGGVQSAGVVPILKKVFYNIYNFYRLLPQVISPYLWVFFIIGLLRWGKDKIENSFRISVIFMVAVTFLVTALTIPLYRYLHPVIPLVYLFATATLVWIVKEIVNSQWLMDKKVRKECLVAGISSVLIFFFVVGQTLGVIFLDSRFKAKTVNKGKPPVYVALSRILKENTGADDVIITNLDT